MPGEVTRVYTRIVWDRGFPQRFMDIMLKDVSDLMYERMYCLDLILAKKKKKN